MPHTPEPWHIYRHPTRVAPSMAVDSIPIPGQPFTGQCPLTDTCALYVENLHRAVECVNACAGIADPADAIIKAYALCQLILADVHPLGGWKEAARITLQSFEGIERGDNE